MEQNQSIFESFLQLMSIKVLGPITGLHILFLITYFYFRPSFTPKKEVKASHILVKTEKECLEIKKKMEIESFEELARKHSLCSSGKEGGSLGYFSPGAMVAEFNEVCFDLRTVIGQVYGPIKTEFGYHLIRVDEKIFDKKLKK